MAQSARGAVSSLARDVSEADRAAQSLRDHWSLGNDPIPNSVELLEEQGIKVLAVDLANIDGLTARVRRAGKGIVPVIVMNRNDWRERQRFTLAHELGHVVMDVAPSLDEEKAAHRFAGAFLMPANALWGEIGKHRTSISLGELFELKQIFGTSVQAITYRCKDLGIFSAALSRRLFNQFDRFGWHQPPYQEPFSSKGDEPKRFERLTFRALAEAAISESKAAELLGVSVRELNRRMDEPPAVRTRRGRKLSFMQVLVSDTSVLVDLERGSLLKASFSLPFQFAVPDLLYERELKNYVGEDLVGLCAITTK